MSKQLDAVQLARLTRFAAKGGIGKCIAVCDCIAQTPGDLMFLKDDEIVVLMQISEVEDLYLGSCEDVIGRFRGQDVQFHGKLKRLVVTKRSSVSKGKKSDSTIGTHMSLARTNASVGVDVQPPASPHSPTPTTPSRSSSSTSINIGNVISMSPSHLVSSSPSPTIDPTASKVSRVSSSESTNSDVQLPAAGSPHSSPHLTSFNSALESTSVTASSPLAVSPLNIVKKSPTSPRFPEPFPTMQESRSNALPIPTSMIPDNTFSTYAEQPSTEYDSDGEVGIGMRLLQSMANGTDSEDDSEFELVKIRHTDVSAQELVSYSEPEEERAVAGGTLEHTMPRVNVEQELPSSGQQPHLSTARSPSPISPISPTSFDSLSPSPQQVQFPHKWTPSRRPSLASSGSWEGAGDIYDDYRYSRASTLSSYFGRTGRMSMSSRMSASSSKVSTTSGKDTWDGHVYEQPPPVPEPRPSIDSVLNGESTPKPGNVTPKRKRSSDIRKSADSRKSSGSHKSAESIRRRHSSDSDFQRLRQELHFPQPPTNVNIEPNLLDQKAKESLRRSSEASRTRTPADFRLSVDSDASVYTQASRLSTIEQELTSSENAEFDIERPNSESINHKNAPSTHLCPDPLDFSRERSPLLHMTWESPAVSPADSAFNPTSIMTPTSSLIMPNALIALTGGMASALRQRIEVDKVPDGPKAEAEDDQSGPEELEYRRKIVVDDEEGIPSEAVQETTLEGDYSKDTIVPATEDDVPSSQGTHQQLLFSEGSDVLPSPMLPLEPPFSKLGSSAYDPPHSPSIMAQRADQSRPTLAEIREGGGTPIPGTNQRRSLFLPHPNAPKPPPVLGPGPMYIASQQPQTPLISDSPAKPTVQAIMHMALNALPPPIALRPKLMGKGPTIYGQTEIDLASASGPVPILFSVEPPTQSATNHYLVTSKHSIAQVQYTSRSESTFDKLSPKGDSNGIAKDAIPRANFFPKSPGSRPRSRSFSALSSFSRQPDVALVSSRDEILATPADQLPPGFKLDVRSSLGSIIQHESLISLDASKHKNSPLRPSPLSLPDSLKPGIIANVPRSPRSPLAQFPATPHSDLSSTASSPPTATCNQLSHQQTTSGSTFAESTLSPPLIHTAASLNSPFLPSPSLRNVTRNPSPVTPQDSTTPSLYEHPSTGPDSDSISTHSDAHSYHVSPPPPVARRSSLRTKLSLPNLRRNRSKLGETSGPYSGSSNDIASTVQVEDLDFELVRPHVTHPQNIRISQDSMMHTNSGLKRPSHDNMYRSHSPASSLSGLRSPTADSFGNWPPAKVAIDTESTMDAHRQRESKWMSLLNSVPSSQFRKSKKVKKLLHEGVPASVRYLVWSHLTEGKMKVVPGVYTQLGKRERILAADMIEEDIQQCFKDHMHLLGQSGPVLSLLQAYLTMVPDVQYTTGLTLIAGQLLLHAPEEDAFWIFVSVMDSHMRPYFSASTIQMEVDSSLFGHVLESNDPLVAKKLFVTLGINPRALCSPWFTSLYVGILPLDYINRIWDLFLYEGIPFLLRVGIAIVTCCRRQILDSTSDDVALKYLRSPPPGWIPSTPEGFLSITFSVRMKDDEVRKQRLKMEAQVKRQALAQITRSLPTGTNISLPRP